MNLVASLLQAIIRVDGDALVMHSGDKPYVVSPSGQTDLSSRGLNLEAINAIVNQLLPIEHQRALEEFGAVQYDMPPSRDFPGERFIVVVARGGDDLWTEVRRRRAGDDDRVPDELFRPPLPAPPVADTTPSRLETHDVQPKPSAPSVVGRDHHDLPDASATHHDLSNDDDLSLPDDVQLIGGAPFARRDVARPGAEAARQDSSSLELSNIDAEVEPAEASAPVPDVASISSVIAGRVASTAPADTAVPEVLTASRPPVAPDVLEIPTALADPVRAATDGAAIRSIVAISPMAVASDVSAAPDRCGNPVPQVVETFVAPVASVVPDVAVIPAVHEIPAAPVVPETAPVPAILAVPAGVAIPESPAMPDAVTGAATPASSAVPGTAVASDGQDVAVIPPALFSLVAPVAPVDLRAPSVASNPVFSVQTWLEDAAESTPTTKLATATPAPADVTSFAISRNASSPPGPSGIIPAAQLTPIAPQPTPAVEPVVSHEVADAAISSNAQDGIHREPPAVHVETSETAPSQPAVVLPIARSPIRLDAPPAPAPERTLSGLERLLRLAAARGASTLYISSQSCSSVRVDGELQMLDGEPVLSPRDVESLLLTLMPERSREALRADGATEWICDIDGIGRVRCMSFRDHRGPGGVFRLMPTRSVSVDQLGLPPQVQAFANEREGLVLVAGPRSSGKRTIMAALVDMMNVSRRDHIITIEREINIEHERGTSFISQRELRGSDEDVLAAARAALREDPDVLFIEDLRTSALVNVALEAAGSGHLVVAGFSAHTASGAIDRIIDLYAPDSRRQVQQALAYSLLGVVAQVLARKVGGGRLPAREVLLNTPSVSSVIADGKTSQLPGAIEGGRRYGMMPLNDALVALVQSGAIDAREAYRQSSDRAGIVDALNHHGIDTSFAERLG